MASNLSELQRGRGIGTRTLDSGYLDNRIDDSRYMDSRYNDSRFTDSTRITDKPQAITQTNSVRHRKEPILPRATAASSLGIKTPPGSPDNVFSNINQFNQVKKKNDY